VQHRTVLYRETVRRRSLVKGHCAENKTSARFIPNQAAGSAARPSDIYEPMELGTGQQHTGPFITKGNNQVGLGGAKMTDGIGFYLDKIEQATQITDNIVSMNGMQSASSWSIQWSSKEAEAGFNALEADYQGKVADINNRYQLTPFPGAGATQDEVNSWLSTNQETATKKQGALSLLGPSPTQQVIKRISSLSGFTLKETKVKPIPEISQAQ
jgi:hypothetical protein